MKTVICPNCGAPCTESGIGISYEETPLQQAAPDLLEALEILLVQFGEYTDGDGAAKLHAINIAKEAIKKAQP